MAGFALVGALVGAVKEIAKGPLVLGPVFAFAISLSEMTLLGLGPFFWSLVIGAFVSLLLEGDGWRRLRAEVAEADREAVEPAVDPTTGSGTRRDVPPGRPGD